MYFGIQLRKSYVLLQKARLARIQIAKATSGAAFVSKKKAAEAKMAARAAHGVDDRMDTKEDVFEMQHHHLLRCLEKTTVSIIELSNKQTPHVYIKCCKERGK